MQLAVENPKDFCTLVVAAFLRPPTKRRNPPQTMQSGRTLRKPALAAKSSKSPFLRTTFISLVRGILVLGELPCISKERLAVRRERQRSRRAPPQGCKTKVETIRRSEPVLPQL